MRLKYQLLLTLLLSGAILIALMAAIGRWNFERGFIAYINNTERQQLQPFVETLAQGYAAEGNWRWITETPDKWRARNQELNRQRPVKIVDTPAFDPRLLLADEHKTLLIGGERVGSAPQWLPIVSMEQTVGYLGYHKRRTLSKQLDRAFATQQRRSFFYTACAMLLLSALLAVLLSTRLVKPILKVNDAVARIGRGEHSHRLTISSKDEIGDLSSTINSLAGSLEKNLIARRQWLAEISHELRTPVAILQGELEAIQDGVQTLDQKAIGSLHAETLRLARLIDDLRDLTLSDIGALDYQFEPLDIQEIFMARVNASHTHIEQASLQITMSPSADETYAPFRINGDLQRLGQLFDNLLQNSSRYTHANGQLHIITTAQNGNVVIDWADSAPGVSDEQLAQLFEPLFRAETSRHRNHGGAGIGLAIVQRIVQAHGGTIQARHSRLGGVTLHIELPLIRESSS